MSLAIPLLLELEAEIAPTRKVLERLPEDKFDWKPHEKSMPLGQLATHVADIPSWIEFTIDHKELLVGDAPPPDPAKNAAELVAAFDKNVEAAKKSLQKVSDDRLMEPWQMKAGDQVLIDMPRDEVIRIWALNHMVHHRAQLSLYLRLNDLPMPAIYGSSADENTLGI